VNVTDRIDLLFKTVTKPDGNEYSYQDVEELTGGVVTRAAIWKARTGKTENPRQRLLGALSKAFQVPMEYFSDEQVTAEDILRYQKQYHSDRLVERIALRSSGLDDDGKQAILDMITFVRKVQGLNGESEGGYGQKEHQDADAGAVG
jgi:transcriptional regulator with XRE-family HTH domain